MDVKAKPEFMYYRWLALKNDFSKKDFRALKGGKVIKVENKLAKKYSHILQEVENNGD